MVDIKPARTPAVEAKVVAAAVEGEASVRDIAHEIGASKSTVHRILRSRHEEIEAKRLQLRETVLDRVIDRAVEATDARMKDAETDSRTAPQSYRAAMEAAGLVGGKTNVFNGNVSVSAPVTVSDERRQLILNSSPEENEAELARLRRELGLG